MMAKGSVNPFRPGTRSEVVMESDQAAYSFSTLAMADAVLWIEAVVAWLMEDKVGGSAIRHERHEYSRLE